MITYKEEIDDIWEDVKYLSEKTGATYIECYNIILNIQKNEELELLRDQIYSIQRTIDRRR